MTQASPTSLKRRDNSDLYPNNTKKGKLNVRNPDSKTISAKSLYTREQLEKIKKLTLEEKRKIRCIKCGLLFHKAADCKNSTWYCHYCHGSNHERKVCSKLKSSKSHFDVKQFTTLFTFIVDSGASHHAVNSREFLIEYIDHKIPIPVQMAKKGDTLLWHGCYSYPP